MLNRGQDSWGQTKWDTSSSEGRETEERGQMTCPETELQLQPAPQSTGTSGSQVVTKKTQTPHLRGVIPETGLSYKKHKAGSPHPGQAVPSLT